jgi:hypothetical protein
MLSVDIDQRISHFLTIQQDTNNPRVNYTLQTHFFPNKISCFSDIFGAFNEDRKNPAELKVHAISNPTFKIGQAFDLNLCQGKARYFKASTSSNTELKMEMTFENSAPQSLFEVLIGTGLRLVVDSSPFSFQSELLASEIITVSSLNVIHCESKIHI